MGFAAHGRDGSGDVAQWQMVYVLFGDTVTGVVF